MLSLNSLFNILCRCLLILLVGTCSVYTWSANILFPGKVSATTDESVVIRGTRSPGETILISIRSADEEGKAFVRSITLSGDSGTSWEQVIPLEVGHNFITIITSSAQSVMDGIRIDRLPDLDEGGEWTNQTKFSSIRDFTVTPDGLVAYALTHGRPIARIDLATGSSTYVYRPGFPSSSVLPMAVRAITFDDRRNRVYAADAGGDIYYMDIVRANMALLASLDIPYTNDSGLRRIHYDPHGDRLLVLTDLNGGEIYAVNLSTGNHQILVSGIHPSLPGYADNPVKFAFDFEVRPDRIFLADFDVGHLVEVNVLTQGRRRIVLPGGIGKLYELAFDAEENALVALAGSTESGTHLLKIDANLFVSVLAQSPDFDLSSSSTMHIDQGKLYISLNPGSGKRPNEIHAIDLRSGDISSFATTLVSKPNAYLLPTSVSDLTYSSDTKEVFIGGQFEYSGSDDPYPGTHAVLAFDPQWASVRWIGAMGSAQPSFGGQSQEGKLYALSGEILRVFDVEQRRKDTPVTGYNFPRGYVPVDVALASGLGEPVELVAISTTNSGAILRPDLIWGNGGFFHEDGSFEGVNFTFSAATPLTDLYRVARTGHGFYYFVEGADGRVDVYLAPLDSPFSLTLVNSVENYVAATFGYEASSDSLLYVSSGRSRRCEIDGINNGASSSMFSFFDCSALTTTKLGDTDEHGRMVVANEHLKRLYYFDTVTGQAVILVQGE